MQYFFHLHECGQVSFDEEGVDLPDVRAAQVQAITAARSIMASEVLSGRLCLACSIEVVDDARARVFDLPFGEALAISGLADDRSIRCDGATHDDGVEASHPAKA